MDLYYVSRLMFVIAISLIVLCMYNLSFKPFFIPYYVVLLPFRVRPIQIIVSKNVLRTFKAEILKIVENIQPQPKKWTFL